LKREAYDELTKFCKKSIPEDNKDFVIKKIQSFRGFFRKELKKVIDSKRFTIDQELPTESICNLMNTVENHDDDTSQPIIESEKIKILDKVYKNKHFF